MTKNGTRLGMLLVILVAVVIASGGDAYAKKPGAGGCPRIGYLCPDVWDPVICDDGQVYSNSCYAWVACATGCEPYGDGGPIVLAGKKKPGGGLDKCPREGVSCIDLWDPVICDDGQVYSNSCYAWVACATGCEPYGDGGPIAAAAKGKPGVGGCPRKGIYCLDVWDPVICDDGQVYSNDCYAWVACATGCEPYGGATAAKGGGCDRPRFCPEVWAPVICDDGKVYPNDCYAQKKCATGCEPYGEWLLAAGGNCDRPKVCPKLWAPVICDDGKVYANSCWAQKKCATGCVPYDDGGPLAAKKRPGGGDDGCPRKGYFCPAVYDPVICDDGQVYGNDCEAWVACATGCEPYGDGGPIEIE